MMYLLVRPLQDYEMLHTLIQLNSEKWYAGVCQLSSFSTFTLRSGVNTPSVRTP